MQNNLIIISCTIFLLFTIVIFSNELIFAEQVTGNVNIINVQDIPPGGTFTITTPQGEILTLSLPPGETATITGQIITTTNPTSGGSAISFLAEVLMINITPSDACTTGCEISFTFDDSHLAGFGQSDPNQVIIFQDSEEDVTFVPLPTFLVDGAPEPYTVSAIITGFSFFGIGVLDDETFCGKTISQWESEGANIIIGTDKKDKLKGTNGVDVILGLEGNDSISGKNGDDCLIGGEGDDRILAGKGNDMVFGGEGNDRLYGSNGNDLVDGGNGKDKIRGGSGNDNLRGGEGDDHVDGDKGDDVITGNVGNDKLHGKKGNDTIKGGPGNDEIKGDKGDDFLDGGEGVDDCNGGSGNDEILNCEDKKDKDNN